MKLKTLHTYLMTNVIGYEGIKAEDKVVVYKAGKSFYMITEDKGKREIVRLVKFQNSLKFAKILKDISEEEANRETCFVCGKKIDNKFVVYGQVHCQIHANTDYQLDKAKIEKIKRFKKTNKFFKENLSPRERKEISEKEISELLDKEFLIAKENLEILAKEIGYSFKGFKYTTNKNKGGSFKVNKTNKEFIIYINPNVGKLRNLKTLYHELGHFTMHYIEGSGRSFGSLEEILVDAVAINIIRKEYGYLAHHDTAYIMEHMLNYHNDEEIFTFLEKYFKKIEKGVLKICEKDKA